MEKRDGERKMFKAKRIDQGNTYNDMETLYNDMERIWKAL